MKAFALLAALAALAVVAVGCGGGGGNESSSEGEALSKPEYLAKGNKICAEGNKEINEKFEAWSKEKGFSKNKQPTEAEISQAAEEFVIPGIKKQVGEIESLPAPEGDEAQVEALLAAVNSAIEKVEEEPALVAQEGEGVFAKANKLAREYGLTTCGEEGEG